VKIKTDGSMRWDTSDSSTLKLSFSMYYVLWVIYSFSLLFDPINMTTEG
jgi:hypothetical protein